MDLYKQILEAAKKNGGREALVIRRRIVKEKVFYKELPGYFGKAAAFLSKEKIGAGERALIWGMNCPEYAVLLLGCFCSGRVAVPVDFRNSEETIAKIVEKTKPKAAWVSRYFRSDFLKEKGIKIYFIEELFEKIKELKPEKMRGGEVAEIVFTSGTTGTPKGVVIKHTNMTANLKAVEPDLPDLTGSRTISILPLSHMLEQIVGLLIPLTHGATIYYLPRINSFRLLSAFAEYRPTHLVVVPQLLKIFWDKLEEKLPKNLPLWAVRILANPVKKIFGGSIRFVACGGAPLDRNVAQNWRKLGLPILEGYGATEVTAIATMNKLGEAKLGSVGRPLPGVEIKLDENGEIYIKSDSIAAGYFEDGERTKAAFTNKGYKTGDIGEWGEDGRLYIKGRDVFKIVLASGEKVFVEDLESKISEDLRIKEACVVAKRVSGGDKIHAYVILRDKKTDLTGVIRDINGKLESKQQITSFEVWEGEDFPRTATLKIDRRQMFEVANGEKAASEVMVKPTVGSFLDIMDIVSRVAGVEKPKISDTDTLAGDLDIDSMGRTELVAMAEEYLGIAIDEGKITAKTTVLDLVGMTKTAESIKDVALPLWPFSWWGRILHDWSLKIILMPIHAAIIGIRYPKGKPMIEPGTVIIFNHPGLLDVMCIFRTLNEYGNLKFVSSALPSFWNKRSLFTKSLELFGGCLPLYDSGNKFMKVMQVQSDLADEGYNLLLAPQGGLQKTDKEDSFRPGVGFILKELKRPVVIMKIKGYRELWPVPDGKDWILRPFWELMPKKRGTVEVVISKVEVDTDKMTPMQITNLLQEKYFAL